MAQDSLKLSDVSLWIFEAHVALTGAPGGSPHHRPRWCVPVFLGLLVETEVAPGRFGNFFQNGLRLHVIFSPSIYCYVSSLSVIVSHYLLSSSLFSLKDTFKGI